MFVFFFNFDLVNAEPALLPVRARPAQSWDQHKFPRDVQRDLMVTQQMLSLEPRGGKRKTPVAKACLSEPKVVLPHCLMMIKPVPQVQPKRTLGVPNTPKWPGGASSLIPPPNTQHSSRFQTHKANGLLMGLGSSRWEHLCRNPTSSLAKRRYDRLWRSSIELLTYTCLLNLSSNAFLFSDFKQLRLKQSLTGILVVT